MYSSAKRLSAISAIACAVNIMGLIMFAMLSGYLGLNFAMSFTIYMFMISSTVVSLMLTLGLRSLCQGLDYDYENTTMKFKEINKKLDEMSYRK